MLKELYQRLLSAVLSPHESPEAVAGGIALGIGVALTPTVGVQMPIAWFLATVCGANRVVAVALVWISNPVTVAPIYYLEYLLGAQILARDAVTSYASFQSLWADLAEYGYLHRIRELSDALLLPLVVGSFVPAILLGSVAYPVSLYAIRRRRQRRAAGIAVAETAEGSKESTESPDSTKESSPARPGPRSRAVILMFVLCSLSRCVDGGSDLSEPGVPQESFLSGTREVWYAGRDSLKVCVAPLYSAQRQDDFSIQRLDEYLAREEGQTGYLTLRLYQFGPPELATSLGADGIAVELRGESGSWQSLKPSELLNDRPVRHRAVLSSLLGAGPLPALGDGQSLELVVAFPPQAPLEDLDSVEVGLWAESLPLIRATVSAAALDALLNEPHQDAFDQLFAQIRMDS